MKYTIGLKIGSKYGFGEIKELIEMGLKWNVNFFEITANDIGDLDYLIKLQQKGIRFGIHIPHSYTPDNPVALCATISPYKKKSLEWFKKSIEIAKKIKAEYIIFHPDLYKVPKGSSRFPEGIKFANNRKEGFRQLIKTIRTYRDNIPLLAEIMPGPDYYNYNLKESLKLKRITGVNFCFDIDHAFEVNQDINTVINWYKGIEKYVEVFHICDFDPEIRGHLPIGDGKIDFEKFFNQCQTRKGQIFILEALSYSKETVKKDLLSSQEKLERMIK